MTYDQADRRLSRVMTWLTGLLDAERPPSNEEILSMITKLDEIQIALYHRPIHSRDVDRAIVASRAHSAAANSRQMG